MLYLIAAFHREKRNYDAWIAENVVMQPIPTDTPILLGWDHQLYIKVAKMFYLQGMNAPQATVAGVHLMAIAEDSSNYIRGPVKIAVNQRIWDSFGVRGIWTKNPRPSENI